jgi:glycosyltransferase 2 family protein
MAPQSSARRARLRTVVIVGLTVALLWYFFRNVQLSEVWRELRGANLPLILATVGATFVTYVFRTWRWQLLLLPVGRARFGPALRATVIGFTAIFLLPGRVGEVLRPYLLSREERLNFSAAFATIIVERVLDLSAALLLFGYFVATVDPRSLGPEFGAVKYAGAVAGIAAMAALAILFVCAGHPERLGRWASALSRLLPGRLSGAVGRFVQTFAEGLGVMRRPGPLLAALTLSIPMWLSVAAGIWFCSRAFDLTFSFSGSFLVVMFLVVGVALPTPGGIGGFEAMYQLAVTRFFGASNDAAVATALVLHALSTIPVSILGVIFMGQMGLTFGGLRHFSAADAKAEGNGQNAGSGRGALP